MTSTQLRGGLAAIALIAIAACSAAGGSNSSAVPATGTGPMSANSALSPDRRRHHKPPNKKRQRSVAGAALAVAGGSINLDQFGSSNSLLMQLLNFGHDVAHKPGRSAHTVSGAPPCQDGVEYSYSSTGQGQVSQSIEFFYDAACTQPYNLVTLDATFTPAGGSAQGTQETWDQSGNVVGYQSYTATFTPGVYGGIGQIVVQQLKAPAPGASPYAQSGFTCLFNTGSAVNCGSGTVANVAAASPTPEEVGFEQTVVGSYVTPSPSPSGYPSPYPSDSPSAYPSGSPEPSPSGWDSANWHHGPPPGGSGWQGDGPSGLQLTINGAGYFGTLNALTLSPGTPPAWTIGGGTQNGTLTGTASIGFGGYQGGDGGDWRLRRGHWGHHGGPGPGCMTSINLTLNDTADGLTVAITSAGHGQLTGAVTETATGTAVATMSLDFSGTGTITYTNGTVDQVQDWVIVN
jgi:hypothetical protein